MLAEPQVVCLLLGCQVPLDRLRRRHDDRQSLRRDEAWIHELSLQVWLISFDNLMDVDTLALDRRQ